MKSMNPKMPLVSDFVLNNSDNLENENTCETVSIDIQSDEIKVYGKLESRNEEYEIEIPNSVSSKFRDLEDEFDHEYYSKIEDLHFEFKEMIRKKGFQFMEKLNLNTNFLFYYFIKYNSKNYKKLFNEIDEYNNDLIDEYVKQKLDEIEIELDAEETKFL